MIYSIISPKRKVIFFPLQTKNAEKQKLLFSLITTTIDHMILVKQVLLNIYAILHAHPCHGATLVISI